MLTLTLNRVSNPLTFCLLFYVQQKSECVFYLCVCVYAFDCLVLSLCMCVLVCGRVCVCSVSMAFTCHVYVCCRCCCCCCFVAVVVGNSSSHLTFNFGAAKMCNVAKNPKRLRPFWQCVCVCVDTI